MSSPNSDGNTQSKEFTDEFSVYRTLVERFTFEEVKWAHEAKFEDTVIERYMDVLAFVLTVHNLAFDEEDDNVKNDTYFDVMDGPMKVVNTVFAMYFKDNTAFQPEFFLATKVVTKRDGESTTPVHGTAGALVVSISTSNDDMTKRTAVCFHQDDVIDHILKVMPKGNKPTAPYEVPKVVDHQQGGAWWPWGKKTEQAGSQDQGRQGSGLVQQPNATSVAGYELDVEAATNAVAGGQLSNFEKKADGEQVIENERLHLVSAASIFYLFHLWCARGASEAAYYRVMESIQRSVFASTGVLACVPRSMMVDVVFAYRPQAPALGQTPSMTLPPNGEQPEAKLRTECVVVNKEDVMVAAERWLKKKRLEIIVDRDKTAADASDARVKRLQVSWERDLINRINYGGDVTYTEARIVARWSPDPDLVHKVKERFAKPLDTHPRNQDVILINPKEEDDYKLKGNGVLRIHRNKNLVPFIIDREKYPNRKAEFHDYYFVRQYRDKKLYQSWRILVTYQVVDHPYASTFYVSESPKQFTIDSMNLELSELSEVVRTDLVSVLGKMKQANDDALSTKVVTNYADFLSNKVGDLWDLFRELLPTINVRRSPALVDSQHDFNKFSKTVDNGEGNYAPYRYNKTSLLGKTTTLYQYGFAIRHDETTSIYEYYMFCFKVNTDIIHDLFRLVVNYDGNGALLKNGARIEQVSPVTDFQDFMQKHQGPGPLKWFDTYNNFVHMYDVSSVKHEAAEKHLKDLIILQEKVADYEKLKKQQRSFYDVSADNDMLPPPRKFSSECVAKYEDILQPLPASLDPFVDMKPFTKDNIKVTREQWAFAQECIATNKRDDIKPEDIAVVVDTIKAILHEIDVQIETLDERRLLRRQYLWCPHEIKLAFAKYKDHDRNNDKPCERNMTLECPNEFDWPTTYRCFRSTDMYDCIFQSMEHVDGTTDVISKKPIKIDRYFIAGYGDATTTVVKCLFEIRAAYECDDNDRVTNTLLPCYGYEINPCLLNELEVRKEIFQFGATKRLYNVGKSACNNAYKCTDNVFAELWNKLLGRNILKQADAEQKAIAYDSQSVPGVKAENEMQQQSSAPVDFVVPTKPQDTGDSGEEGSEDHVTALEQIAELSEKLKKRKNNQTPAPLE